MMASDSAAAEAVVVHDDLTDPVLFSSVESGLFSLPGLNFDLDDLSFPMGSYSDDRSGRQMCFSDDENCNMTEAVDRVAQPGLEGRMPLLRSDSWMLPMLIVSSINVTVIVMYEVFVVCKASQNSTSRRHLFLGQMLLLGLLLGSGSGFAYSVQPNDFSCAAIRLGTGLSYSLIYSSLLVKLVFLISLNTGVYLPAIYQALLYLFCIIVQVVIGVQWLASRPSFCVYTAHEHILTLLYNVFLILFVSGLAIKSWSYRDNYRESKYIGVLMAVTVPTWLAWIMAAIVLNEAHQAACSGFGLLSVCLITFVIMFLPKSRQLSAVGKEGIYIDDQEEEDSFSFRSDHYSPSFYHYRPSPNVMSGSGGHKSLFPSQGSQFSSGLQKEWVQRPGSPLFKASTSYAGFHRPLRVVPPSASTPPSPVAPPAPPPSYSTQINSPYFPSHFFPEKLHYYWQYYSPPRLSEVYKRMPAESVNNIYMSLYDQERTKSVNPNVYFYRANSYQLPGLVY